jgi:hypothetical protein
MFSTQPMRFPSQEIATGQRMNKRIGPGYLSMACLHKVSHCAVATHTSAKIYYCCACQKCRCKQIIPCPVTEVARRPKTRLPIILPQTKSAWKTTIIIPHHLHDGWCLRGTMPRPVMQAKQPGGRRTIPSLVPLPLSKCRRNEAPAQRCTKQILSPVF